MPTQKVDMSFGSAIVLIDSLGGGFLSSQALTMKNLGNVYRQSAKFDLGANPAPFYEVLLQNAFQLSPAANTVTELWIGFSDQPGLGTNNCGGCSGVDSAYTGLTGGSVAQSLRQLDYVGQLILDANQGPQRKWIGAFVPRNRYAYVVWHNGSGQFTTNTSDQAVVINPAYHNIEQTA